MKVDKKRVRKLVELSADGSVKQRSPRFWGGQVLKDCAHRPSLQTLAPGSGSLLQVRAGNAQKNGLEYCRAVIAEIRRVKTQNPAQRCAVVFDLDNTLFETRFRTKHALQEFDQHHGTTHFKNLELQDVCWNGEETAVRLGLSKDIVAKVQDFWEQSFWNGDNFLRDGHIGELHKLVKEAKAAGAEIFYLTGRITSLRKASIRQVQNAKLPNADEAHMLTKPNVGVKTGPFKAGALRDLLNEGVYLGFFVTDNRKEISDVQETDETLPCVLYEHPLQRPGDIIDDTPIIEAFGA